MTTVDPTIDPEEGEIPKTEGAASYAKARVAEEKSAPLFETAIAAEEAPSEGEGGEAQMISVDETKVAPTSSLPNLQTSSLENAKSEPVTVTEVEPVEGPDVGETEERVTGAVKTKSTGDAKKSVPPLNDSSSEAEVGEVGGVVHSTCVDDT